MTIAGSLRQSHTRRLPGRQSRRPYAGASTCGTSRSSLPGNALRGKPHSGQTSDCSATVFACTGKFTTECGRSRRRPCAVRAAHGPIRQPDAVSLNCPAMLALAHETSLRNIADRSERCSTRHLPYRSYPRQAASAFRDRSSARRCWARVSLASQGRSRESCLRGPHQHFQKKGAGGLLDSVPVHGSMVVLR